MARRRIRLTLATVTPSNFAISILGTPSNAIVKAPCLRNAAREFTHDWHVPFVVLFVLRNSKDC